MKVKRNILVAASLLAMLATTGCKREAIGQVVAVVNGEEITRQEVDAELDGHQLPQGVDPKQAQQVLLQRIIDRHLISAAARADGIDKDQEFLLRQRKMDDNLLIDLLGQRNARTFRIPDNAEIDKYVAAHPSLFGNRTIFKVDKILFPPPADVKKLQQLTDDHSLDAVAARLTSLGIKFTRSEGELDSAVMPPQMTQRIQKLPSGEPFLIPQPGAIFVGVVTGTVSAPMTPEDARPIAVGMMRKDAVYKALDQRLKAAKAEAKIDYQPGYAPTAKTPGA